MLQRASGYKYITFFRKCNKNITHSQKKSRTSERGIAGNAAAAILARILLVFLHKRCYIPENGTIQTLKGEKMSKKSKIVTAVVAAIAVAAIAFFGIRNQMRKRASDDKNIIRIGVILPLTGVSSDLAEPMVIAMKIAEQKINGERPEHKKKIRIDFEDGKSTASATISAYQKMYDSGVAACVVFGDVQCYNLAPVVNKAPKPVMALSAAAENIPELSTHFFRAWTTTRDSCTELANFSHAELKAQSIAILAINNNFGDEAKKAVCDFAKKNNIKVVRIETFEIDAQNVRGQIQKCLQITPDVIFVFGFGPGYIKVFNQLKESGFKGAILTDEVITIPGYSDKITADTADIYYSSTTFNPLDKKSVYYDSFVLPFELKTHYLPNAHAAFAYFSIDSLVRAIDLANEKGIKIEEAFVLIGEFPSIIGPVKFTRQGELKTDIFIRKK